MNNYTVGGNVSGLVGTVVLQNNGADNLSISADGPFTFPIAIPDGNAYNVTILTQPATQTCFVTNGSGTISGANVTNVTVSCTTHYTVGGTVSGLVGTVVLQNNLADDLSISANGPFTFSTPVLDGQPYSVTVLTQPATQTCFVTNGSGTISGANVTNVSVACTTHYTVGGTISGLVGTVVLQNNGADNLSRSANGSFTFATPVLDGNAYSVTVFTQPAGQTCTVTNGSGTISGANVTNVTVSCVNNYTVGGNVTGLVGSVTLQNNGGDNLVINSDGPFTFATAIPDGSTYNVTVFAQPAMYTCTVNSGSGTISGANVTNVDVHCSINTYTIGGTVSGLVGSVTLQNNLADDLVVNADGPFTFSTPIADGATYDVTVSVQPLTQTCSVSSGSGTVSGANVTTVMVTCSTNTYTVGGAVSGLSGTVILQDNGGDDLSISADGPFTFSTPVADGSPYAVTVLTQPSGQTCNVTDGSGTISGANVTDVAVDCTNNVTTISVPSTGTIPVTHDFSITNTVTVTNTGSFPALNVKAVLPWSSSNVGQDASGCTSIPVSGSCQLIFSSNAAFIAQGGISITGDNVTSPPTMAFAFTYSGYLVVDVVTPTLYAVVDDTNVASARWSGVQVGGANSFTDGATNGSIINSTPGANPSAAGNCYASTNGGQSAGSWYLPAICQMGGIGAGAGCASNATFNNLVVLGYLPSNTYWSSTVNSGNNAVAWVEQTGNPDFQSNVVISSTLAVRCMLNASY